MGNKGQESDSPASAGCLPVFQSLGSTGEWGVLLEQVLTVGRVKIELLGIRSSKPNWPEPPPSKSWLPQVLAAPLPLQFCHLETGPATELPESLTLHGRVDPQDVSQVQTLWGGAACDREGSHDPATWDSCWARGLPQSGSRALQGSPGQWEGHRVDKTQISALLPPSPAAPVWFWGSAVQEGSGLGRLPAHP